jgi:esterase/lipase
MDIPFLTFSMMKIFCHKKISQLSTNVRNEKPPMMKNISNEIDKIPDYLTKRNKSFKQIMHQVLSKMTMVTTKNNNIEELRKNSYFNIGKLYSFKLIIHYGQVI